MVTYVRAEGRSDQIGAVFSLFFLFCEPGMQEVCGTWKVAEIWGDAGVLGRGLRVTGLSVLGG